MEVEGRLIGEHIHIVMMNMHAISHLLDDDATGAIANEPVQQGLLLAGHDLRNERHVLQRLFDFVDTVEIACHPQREFESGDVSVPSTGSCAKEAYPGKFNPATAKPCSLAQSKYMDDRP